MSEAYVCLNSLVLCISIQNLDCNVTVYAVMTACSFKKSSLQFLFGKCLRVDIFFRDYIHCQWYLLQSNRPQTCPLSNSYDFKSNMGLIILWFNQLPIRDFSFSLSFYVHYHSSCLPLFEFITLVSTYSVPYFCPASNFLPLPTFFINFFLLNFSLNCLEYVPLSAVALQLPLSGKSELTVRNMLSFQFYQII